MIQRCEKRILLGLTFSLFIMLMVPGHFLCSSKVEATPLPPAIKSLLLLPMPFIGLTQVTTSNLGNSSHPSINTLGTQISFQSSSDLTGSNADGNMEIFLYNISAASIVQITTTTGCSNKYPSIDANGKRLVFQSDCTSLGINPDGNAEIFVFDSTTGVTSQITTTAGGSNENPSISGDGTRIVFQSDIDYTGGNADGNTEVFLFDTTAGFTQVTASSAALGMLNSVAPHSLNTDGTKIALFSNADYTGGNADGSTEIFVFDTRGGGSFLQTTDSTTLILHTNPTISADGRCIVAVKIDIILSSTEFFLIDLSTLTSTPLTSLTDGSHVYPSINSDCSRITFASNGDHTGDNADGNFEIFRYSITKGYSQITHSIGGDTAQPAISGDGTHIAFISNSDLTSENADGNSEIFLDVRQD